MTVRVCGKLFVCSDDDWRVCTRPVGHVPPHVDRTFAWFDPGDDAPPPMEYCSLHLCHADARPGGGTVRAWPPGPRIRAQYDGVACTWCLDYAQELARTAAWHVVLTFDGPYHSHRYP